jgi:hypothetical protein
MSEAKDTFWSRKRILITDAWVFVPCIEECDLTGEDDGGRQEFNG